MNRSIIATLVVFFLILFAWLLDDFSLEHLPWLLLAFVVILLICHFRLGLIDKSTMLRTIQEEQLNVAQLRAQIVVLTAEARHDKLTSLGNRNFLDDRFEIARERALRNATNFALMMIDLNGFKLVNDKYGHLAGDLVLMTVANRLENSVRRTDSVVRLGGDEFVILMEDIEHSNFLVETSDKLLKIISEKIELSDHQFAQVSASFGISIFPNDGIDMATLLEVADQGMYECKSSGHMPLS